MKKYKTHEDFCNDFDCHGSKSKKLSCKTCKQLWDARQAEINELKLLIRCVCAVSESLHGTVSSVARLHDIDMGEIII